MTDLLLLLLSAALVNNFVLVQFLGLCPFVGMSARLQTAVPMTLATTFVLCVAALGTWAVHAWLLAPLGIEYLRVIAFIVVIAAAVQLTEAFVRAASPVLHRMLGIYLPLITTNCAVLGVALIAVERDFGLLHTLTLAIGAGLGFGLAIVAFGPARAHRRCRRAERLPGPALGLGDRGLHVTRALWAQGHRFVIAALVSRLGTALTNGRCLEPFSRLKNGGCAALGMSHLRWTHGLRWGEIKCQRV